MAKNNDTETKRPDAALALREAAPLPSRGFMLPANLRDAQEIAKVLASSDFVPKDYRGKPGNVVVALQLGAELGLSPMQAVQGIAVVGGRPAVWGDMLLALCLAHPECQDIREAFDAETGTAICTVLRRGRQPVARSFSIEDAKRAGLWNKEGPWRTYPERMLAMRARAFACRDAFADALRGVQSIEEQRDVLAHREAEAAARNARVVDGREVRTERTEPVVEREPEADEPPVDDAPAADAASSADDSAESPAGGMSPPESDPIVGGILRRIKSAASVAELGQIGDEIAASVGPHLAGADRAALKDAYKARVRELAAEAAQ
jgi:hypothetical protein